MNNTNSKSFFIITGMFIAASGIRIILDGNKYILNIVATINIISLWYVFYLILDSSEKYFTKEIDNTKIRGEKIKRKKKKAIKKFSNILSLLILGLGILYIFKLANPVINDIIGLCALFLSIETEYIYKYITNIFINAK